MSDTGERRLAIDLIPKLETHDQYERWWKMLKTGIERGYGVDADIVIFMEDPGLAPVTPLNYFVPDQVGMIEAAKVKEASSLKISVIMAHSKATQAREATKRRMFADIFATLSESAQLRVEAGATGEYERTFVDRKPDLSLIHI